MINEEQLPVSVDTAVEIIGYLFAKACRDEDAATDARAKEVYRERAAVLRDEISVVRGNTDDDARRMNVFNKVVSEYAPLVRQYLGN